MSSLESPAEQLSKQCEQKWGKTETYICPFQCQLPHDQPVGLVYFITHKHFSFPHSPRHILLILLYIYVWLVINQQKQCKRDNCYVIYSFAVYESANESEHKPGEPDLLGWRYFSWFFVSH